MKTIEYREEGIMGLTVAIGIMIAYIVLSLALLPMQYRYIKELKDMDRKRKDLGMNQNEYYEQMTFENQLLHLNAQGNIIFIGANALAEIVYYWKNKKRAIH